MFRITQGQRSEAVVLRLEGSLTAAELPLLEQALSAANGSQLRLDLSGVRWIDERAAERLHVLRDGGACLAQCSPFVAKLLSAPR